MSARRTGKNMASQLASLRSPLLSGSPKEVLDLEEDKETKETEPPKETKESGESQETKDTEEAKENREKRTPKENRETTSPKLASKRRPSRYGRGYRKQTDKYGKASYWLRHDQIENIRREADIRGMEISEFARLLVQDYYTRNPLTEERIRQLIEERILGEFRDNSH